MIYIILKKFFFILLFSISSFAYGNESNINRIEVLVNEEAITKYDIIQRLKINSILKRIEINDDNFNQLYGVIMDDLIIEKLKINKIQEYNIEIEKDEFSQHEIRFYSSLNYNKQTIEELFVLNNINYNYLNEFLEIDLKWQKLIYGLYLRVTSVTKNEIYNLINKNPNLNEESASDLILQKQIDLKSIKLINDLRDEATIEYR